MFNVWKQSLVVLTSLWKWIIPVLCEVFWLLLCQSVSWTMLPAFQLCTEDRTWANTWMPYSHFQKSQATVWTPAVSWKISATRTHTDASSRRSVSVNMHVCQGTLWKATQFAVRLEIGQRINSHQCWWLWFPILHLEVYLKEDLLSVDNTCNSTVCDTHVPRTILMCNVLTAIDSWYALSKLFVCVCQGRPLARR